jgi:hypothetical protein
MAQIGDINGHGAGQLASRNEDTSRVSRRLDIAWRRICLCWTCAVRSCLSVCAVPRSNMTVQPRPITSAYRLRDIAEAFQAESHCLRATAHNVMLSTGAEPSGPTSRSGKFHGGPTSMVRSSASIRHSHHASRAAGNRPGLRPIRAPRSKARPYRSCRL